MPKRKYGSTFSRAQKRRRKAAPRRRKPLTSGSRFRARVKRVLLNVSEPKHHDTNWGKVELNHNVHTQVCNSIIGTGELPDVGDAYNQRDGDKIFLKGIGLRFLLGQKADRPNVTFRITVVGYNTVQGNPNTYAELYDNVTGNGLLDTVRYDKFSKIYVDKKIRISYANNVTGSVAGETNTGELTKPMKIYIPFNKFLTFSNGSLSSKDLPEIIRVFCLPYDAYGTLLTDNIGYIQLWQRVYYKDV